jgi:hypothetical protein
MIISSLQNKKRLGGGGSYSATDFLPRHFHFFLDNAFAHGGFLHFLILRERAQYASPFLVPGLMRSPPSLALPFWPKERHLPLTRLANLLPFDGLQGFFFSSKGGGEDLIILMRMAIY